MKFELNVPFGDDEHTAAEGAYARVLKSRKLLYFTSAAAALHGHGLINYGRISKVLADTITLNPRLAKYTIVAALSVTLAQYGLLLVQLAASYSVIVRERLLARVAEQAAQINSALEAAHQHLFTLQQAQNDGQAKQSRLTGRKAALQRQIADAHEQHQGELSALEFSELFRDESAEVDRLGSDAVNLDAQMTLRHAEIGGVKEMIAQHHERLSELQRRTPESKRSYRYSEYAHDAVRAGIPLAFALYAVCVLVADSLPV